MCRLSGIMANKPVKATFSLIKADNSLRTQVDSRKKQQFKNADGWGIGYRDSNGVLAVEKEAGSAKKNPLFMETAITRNSQVFISHIRYGDIRSRVNTHPFKRRGWIFAHNGIINNKERLEGMLTSEEKPYGDTDSERFFLLVLQEHSEAIGMVEAITRAVIKIRNRTGYSALNFLMTDGKRIYAYKDKSQSDKGDHRLYWLFRDPTNQQHNYSTGELEILYNEKRERGEKAVIIASEKMTTGEEWVPFENKQLLVVDEMLEMELYRINKE